MVEHLSTGLAIRFSPVQGVNLTRQYAAVLNNGKELDKVTECSESSLKRRL